MRKDKKQSESDLIKCKSKLLAILEKYNCELISADEYVQVLIRDKDTDKTVHWSR